MDTIGEPEGGEYAPHFERYVSLVRGVNILVTLEAQTADVLRTLGNVPEACAGSRYAPGKWSVREVVGHCTDSERVFAYRALAIARGEQAPLPAFDENSYARLAGHDAVALARLLAEFETVRKASLHLLRNLPPEAWVRGGTASGKPITVRALAFVMAGHVAHHMAILRERYGLPA